MFSPDFFKWFRFVIILIRAISEIFGSDDDDKQVDNALNQPPLKR